MGRVSIPSRGFVVFYDENASSNLAKSTVSIPSRGFVVFYAEPLIPVALPTPILFQSPHGDSLSFYAGYWWDVMLDSRESFNPLTGIRCFLQEGTSTLTTRLREIRFNPLTGISFVFYPPRHQRDAGDSRPVSIPSRGFVVFYL